MGRTKEYEGSKNKFGIMKTIPKINGFHKAVKKCKKCGRNFKINTYGNYYCEKCDA